MDKDKETIVLNIDWIPIKESDYKHPNEKVKVFSLDLGCEITNYNGIQ